MLIRFYLNVNRKIVSAIFRRSNAISDMKAKILLKIAAGLILIHLFGHGVGHKDWDKPTDPKMMDVVTAMKSHQGEFMGAVHSMADYYKGYSILIFGLYGMSIAILWFASGFVQDHPAIANQVLYPIGIAYLFFGIVEYMYFFPFAASISFLAGVLTILSMFIGKR
jgi:hypothetical protein